MKLSEIKGEKALDVLADIIDPIGEICADEAVKNAFRGKKKTEAIKILLKTHKASVIAVLAALECVPVEEFSVNVLTLPAKILEVLNDTEVARLFTFAGPKEAGSSSGSALESAEAEA